ncbi:MAG TPA: sugar kinase [Anaerolineae bacterium]|nr:sugar kinase [Anaerolineae bacterium]
MADILCLGIMVADVVARPVTRFPERGRLELVDEMSLHTGGCAVNSGITLARLGFSVGVIGKVGSDGFGDFIVAELEREGVDTIGVRRDQVVHTSATMVMVDPDGERRFIHYLGANATLREGDVDFDLIARAKILHVAGSLVLPGIDGEPTARILRRAKELGVTTALDTVWDATGRWMALVGPSLPHVDYFLPSLAEAQQLTGKQEPVDVAEALLAHGVRVVGLKMGEAGCYVRTADTELRLPAYRVQAVDATGAGDAWAAGFLAGVLQGWDLARTARFANAVGALCVTAMGATGGVRSLEETLAFLAERE